MLLSTWALISVERAYAQLSFRYVNNWCLPALVPVATREAAVVSAVHLSWFPTVNHQWGHQLLFLLRTLQLFSLSCGLQKCISYGSHIVRPFLPLCVKEFIPERHNICCTLNLVPNKLQDYLVRKEFELSEIDKQKAREKKTDPERLLRGFSLVLLPWWIRTRPVCRRTRFRLGALDTWWRSP